MEGAADIHDLLRRSRLARNRDREAAEDGRRRPERGMRRLEQALLHDRQRLWIDTGALRLRRLRMRDRAARTRLLDPEQHVRRHELAAVRDQRVEARHLQRRHEQVLLTDRELDGVARLPELVDRRLEMRFPPLRRRQQALRLGTDVDARVLPEAEA